MKYANRDFHIKSGYCGLFLVRFAIFECNLHNTKFVKIIVNEMTVAVTLKNYFSSGELREAASGLTQKWSHTTR
jgi:hypothetical protein